MTTYLDNGVTKLMHGDVRETLAMLADQSIHAVCTSPPYWNLRDYSIGYNGIGLEPTPELYVEHLVEVFRAVRRALRDDGLCFVNLGDSYSSGGRSDYGHRLVSETSGVTNRSAGLIRPDSGLKPLDLVNMPHRVASALQADGWHWRSTIVWAKPAPMPESVNGTRWEPCRAKVKVGTHHSGGVRGNAAGDFHKSLHERSEAQYTPCPGCVKCKDNDGFVLRRGSWRPTTAHEYIFMFSKTARYFADAEAVREKAIDAGRIVKASGKNSKTALSPDSRNDRRTAVGFSEHDTEVTGRNPRTVWSMPSQPYAGAHFATFPEELPRRCILAATSEAGCCADCGAQWAPIVEGGFTDHDGQTASTYDETMTAGRLAKLRQAARAQGGEYQNTRKVLGHRPTCDCGALSVPATVLDPFSGSGTTNLVAQKLGRCSIGIDLSEAYLDLARRRLEAVTLPMRMEV